MDISEEIKIASTGSRIAPSNFFPLSYISLQKCKKLYFLRHFSYLLAQKTTFKACFPCTAAYKLIIVYLLEYVYNFGVKYPKMYTHNCR